LFWGCGWFLVLGGCVLGLGWAGVCLECRFLFVSLLCGLPLSLLYGCGRVCLCRWGWGGCCWGLVVVVVCLGLFGGCEVVGCLGCCLVVCWLGCFCVCWWGWGGVVGLCFGVGWSFGCLLGCVLLWAWMCRKGWSCFLVVCFLYEV
ncbi:hypothetical protein ACTHTW_11200, partial [Neisseria sp. P0018.S006]